MFVLYNNRYNRDRKMTSRRVGVLYNIDQEGTARVIFNSDRSKFQGLLVGTYDDCISLRGKLVSKTEDPSTSVMNITLIEGETGNEFQINNVVVRFTHNPNPISTHFFVTIDNPCITFRTTSVLYGNRADVEIRKYMDPTLVDSGSFIHVGHMKVQLMTSHRPKPSNRRESVCDSCNPAILELSDDFLA